MIQVRQFRLSFRIFLLEISKAEIASFDHSSLLLCTWMDGGRPVWCQGGGVWSGDDLGVGAWRQACTMEVELFLDPLSRSFLLCMFVIEISKTRKISISCNHFLVQIVGSPCISFTSFLPS